MNKITYESYIGATKKLIEQRRAQHIQDAKRGSKLFFHRELKKYGQDYFEWTILDEAKNWDELMQKEKLWIEKYKTFSEGYNLTKGGEGCKGFKLKNGRSKSWELKQSISHIKRNKEFISRLQKTKESIYTEEQRSVYSKNQTGDKNSSVKITKEQVFEIYKLWDSGSSTMTEIATIYPVNRRHVGRIVKGETRVSDFKEYYGKEN